MLIFKPSSGPVGGLYSSVIINNFQTEIQMISREVGAIAREVICNIIYVIGSYRGNEIVDLKGLFYSFKGIGRQGAER